MVLTPRFLFNVVMKIDLPSLLLESLDKLPERAEGEMMKQGGTYPLVFAFAQRPATP